MSSLMTDQEALALADEILSGEFDWDLGSSRLKIAGLCYALKRAPRPEEPRSDSYAFALHADGTATDMDAYQEEQRQDAERWRCLKRHHLQTGTDSWIRTGDDLEEAVDALLESDRRIADGLRSMNVGGASK